jgi:hypothetical protein
MACHERGRSPVAAKIRQAPPGFCIRGAAPVFVAGAHFSQSTFDFIYIYIDFK